MLPPKQHRHASVTGSAHHKLAAVSLYCWVSQGEKGGRACARILTQFFSSWCN